MEKKFESAPPRQVLGTYFNHAKKYPWLLVASVLGSVLVQTGGVIVPVFYKKLFDGIAGSVINSQTVNALIQILLTILLLYGVIWCMRRINQFAVIYLETRVMRDLTRHAFGYMLGHSYSFFVNNFTGSLVRRITRLSRSFEDLYDQLVFNFIPVFITLTGICIVLFQRHIFLGGAFLTWVVILITVQVLLALWKQKFNIEVSEKDSKVTATLSDSISNDMTVKLFAGEERENSILAKVTGDLQKLMSRSWSIDEWINLTQGLLAIAVEMVLMYGCIKLWSIGKLTVGDFALVQSYLVASMGMLWDFGRVVRRAYSAFADAGEMVHILNTPHEVADRSNAGVLKISEGRIDFSGVTFSYRNNVVLKDLNLAILPGERVALVGPSGAGKTTITKLLFRFYDIDSGVISIDGQNIAFVTQKSLRENISLVPQEPILFHRTLMDNIRYGRPEASEEEVIEAAKQAHCHEFISTLPEGYETFVGERGIKLSGGERQRVAIARAILKNAPILVLDEATSSLDSESEALIQDALENLMKDKTVIVIAHRLSTVMKMDRIIVIESGKVSLSGTHKELLAHENSLYKKLWEIQAGGFIE